MFERTSRQDAYKSNGDEEACLDPRIKRRFGERMAGVTVPGPPAIPRSAPGTRRAARELREEAERRARAEAGGVSEPSSIPVAAGPATPQGTLDPAVSFELPSDEFAPATAPVAGPAALPPELRVREPAQRSPDPVGRQADRSLTRAQLRVRPRPAPRPEHSARRAARAAGLLEDGDSTPVRHARPRRLARVAVVVGLAAGATLLLGAAAAVTALVLPEMSAPPQAATSMSSQPRGIEQLPVPEVEQTPPTVDLCAVPEFATAVEARDDEAAVVAAGGGEAFRAAVVDGHAACVDLADSARIWTVVDKLRPTTPIDYRPTSLVLPDGVRNIEGGALRSDAAAALTALVAAAQQAGVGEIALESAFRSYQTQQETYGRHFAARGEQADQVSARPGYSEHQLGLAADVVACAGSCGGLDALAGTPQGEWVAAHSWEHGWIVRYVEGATPVTGYLPEPWHLRYIGPELARAYHEGGWTSLEEFFGLPPAPGYAN